MNIYVSTICFSHLVSHDRQLATFMMIKAMAPVQPNPTQPEAHAQLAALSYSGCYQLLQSRNYGSPQHRIRPYMPFWRGPQNLSAMSLFSNVAKAMEVGCGESDNIMTAPEASRDPWLCGIAAQTRCKREKPSPAADREAKGLYEARGCNYPPTITSDPACWGMPSHSFICLKDLHRRGLELLYFYIVVEKEIDYMTGDTIYFYNTEQTHTFQKRKRRETPPCLVPNGRPQPHSGFDIPWIHNHIIHYTYIYMFTNSVGLIGIHRILWIRKQCLFQETLPVSAGFSCDDASRVWFLFCAFLFIRMVFDRFFWFSLVLLNVYEIIWCFGEKQKRRVPNSSRNLSCLSTSMECKFCRQMRCQLLIIHGWSMDYHTWVIDGSWIIHG